MDEFKRAGEVIEGWAEATTDLIADWTGYSAALATKLGSGSYGQEEGSADLSIGLRLLTSSAMRMTIEALETWSILTGDFDETLDTGQFATDPLKATGPRSLTVVKDLESVTGAKLPATRVTPVPSTLNTGATVFTLHVDGSGMKARIYDGEVIATDQAGGTEAVPVSVTIG
jgi:hypothetical protein